MIINDELAEEMLEACARDGQSARRVTSDADAADLRAALRQLARIAGTRIRTARIDDTVVVVRTDASIWNDDAATMRAKLQPPD